MTRLSRPSSLGSSAATRREAQPDPQAISGKKRIWDTVKGFGVGFVKNATVGWHFVDYYNEMKGLWSKGKGRNEQLDLVYAQIGEGFRKYDTVKSTVQLVANVATGVSVLFGILSIFWPFFAPVAAIAGIIATVAHGLALLLRVPSIVAVQSALNKLKDRDGDAAIALKNYRRKEIGAMVVNGIGVLFGGRGGSFNQFAKADLDAGKNLLTAGMKFGSKSAETAAGVGMGEIGNRAQDMIGGSVSEDMQLKSTIDEGEVKGNKLDGKDLPNPVPEVRSETKKFKKLVRKLIDENKNQRKEAGNEQAKTTESIELAKQGQVNLGTVAKDVSQISESHQKISKDTQTVSSTSTSSVQDVLVDPEKVGKDVEGKLPSEADGTNRKAMIGDELKGAEKPGWIKRKIMSKAEEKKKALTVKVTESTKPDDSAMVEKAQTAGIEKLGALEPELQKSSQQIALLDQQLMEMEARLAKLELDLEEIGKRLDALEKDFKKFDKLANP